MKSSFLQNEVYLADIVYEVYVDLDVIDIKMKKKISNGIRSQWPFENLQRP